MKKKARMTREKLMSTLKHESVLGYPAFRNEIISILHAKYDLDLQWASVIVWGDWIGDKLMEDVEWARHMGLDYWATFIFLHDNNATPKWTESIARQF